MVGQGAAPNRLPLHFASRGVHDFGVSVTLRADLEQVEDAFHSSHRRACHESFLVQQAFSFSSMNSDGVP